MPNFQENNTSPIQHLWVREGKLDLPIFFPPHESGKKVIGFHLDFSGLTGDGFMEIKAVDPDHITQSRWWCGGEKILFKFRASVLALSMDIAILRSEDFVEQMLDRITFLTGSPSSLVEFGMVYNESRLLECQQGCRKAIECSSGGTFCRTTLPVANLHIAHKMSPSERAKRALRWFRKAMCFDNVEDRFLGYYFALECISNDIEETKETTHKCKNCGQSTGIGKAQTDGIKALIKKRAELPADFFKKISSARGKLVHGDKADEVFTLEPILQRLTADGIAISLGVDPSTVNIANSSRPKIWPIMEVEYSDCSSHINNEWSTTISELLKKLREHYEKTTPNTAQTDNLKP